MQKNVFIVCANPIGSSFSNAMADTAAKALLSSGHQVHVQCKQYIIYDRHPRCMHAYMCLLYHKTVHVSFMNNTYPNTKSSDMHAFIQCRCEGSICTRCLPKRPQDASCRCCLQRRGQVFLHTKHHAIVHKKNKEKMSAEERAD